MSINKTEENNTGTAEAIDSYLEFSEKLCRAMKCHTSEIAWNVRITDYLVYNGYTPSAEKTISIKIPFKAIYLDLFEKNFNILKKELEQYNIILTKFHLGNLDVQYTIIYKSRVIGHLVLDTFMSFYNICFIIDKDFYYILDTSIITKLEVGKNPVVNMVRYDRNNGIWTALTAIKVDKVINNDKLFPILSKSVREYWNDFNNSESKLLLLIGKPGTGKSSLINAILRERGYDTNIYSVSNSRVLKQEDFIDFIYTIPEGSILIIEDADLFVSKRTEGNELMSGFLNLISGVADINIKIIITTNLPTTKDIDEALLRPGRCYDILKFRYLTPYEANEARISVGKDSIIFPEEVKELSLAEAINYEEIHKENRAKSIGFIS